jgi:hypothetical protein
MPEEVEIEICCDVLLDVVESGGIQVVEVKPGIYCEVIPDQEGETGIAINFCPFCGQARPNSQEAGTPALDATSK